MPDAVQWNLKGAPVAGCRARAPLMVACAAWQRRKRSWQKQTSHTPSFDLAYSYQTFRNLFPTHLAWMWESVVPTRYKMSAWAGEVISILSGCSCLKSLTKLLTDRWLDLRTRHWGSKKTPNISSKWLSFVVVSSLTPSYDKATYCSINRSAIASWSKNNQFPDLPTLMTRILWYQQNITKRRWNKYKISTKLKQLLFIPQQISVRMHLLCVFVCICRSVCLSLWRVNISEEAGPQGCTSYPRESLQGPDTRTPSSIIKWTWNSWIFH